MTPRNDTPAVYERKSQAEKICELFAGIEIDGTKYRAGPAALAAAMKATGASYNRAAIYKWLWPVERNGTGGIIPTRAIPHVERAARTFGLFIPAGFLDPRGQKIKARKPRSDLAAKSQDAATPMKSAKEELNNG